MREIRSHSEGGKDDLSKREKSGKGREERESGRT